MPTILIAALTFGASGLAIAWLILHGRPGGLGDWASLPISSAAAAFGVSFVLWRLFCAPDHLVSSRRGALVGALTGLLAHPVAWYLVILWSYVTGARSSLGDRAANPLEGLTGCLVFAFWSILLMGWLTVPAGGIVGWILGRALRPR